MSESRASRAPALAAGPAALLAPRQRGNSARIRSGVTFSPSLAILTHSQGVNRRHTRARWRAEAHGRARHRRVAGPAGCRTRTQSLGGGARKLVEILRRCPDRVTTSTVLRREPRMKVTRWVPGVTLTSRSGVVPRGDPSSRTDAFGVDVMVNREPVGPIRHCRALSMHGRGSANEVARDANIGLGIRHASHVMSRLATRLLAPYCPSFLPVACLVGSAPVVRIVSAGRRREKLQNDATDDRGSRATETRTSRLLELSPFERTRVP
jgi:hypothetical protein